jgi:chemotaxis protein MotA
MASEVKSKSAGKGAAPDLATLLGLAVAGGGILGGLLLEGGKMSDIMQFTAAMIVLGGTLGAVMVTTPMPVLIGAAKRLKTVFFAKSHDCAEVIETIIGYATKARKSSIISLENDLDSIEDPFLRKALSLAVDGADLQDIRKVMELDMTLEEKRVEAEGKVYEAAGGYAPTVGIIGAVLGLIQVMKHLENIEEVGKGIAVAFVATVYGVGVSNLFFLPAGNKIKARLHHDIQVKELILEGVCSIVEGLNPKLIRTKLEAFAHQDSAKGKSKAGAAQPKAAAAQAAAAGS